MKRETFTGKCSTFGGPKDRGVTASEGLALFAAADVANPKHAALFLSRQPRGTTGVARRLNPDALYCAMRWSYAKTSRAFLRGALVTVRANGKTIQVRPCDWGPNIRTARIIDLSPGAALALGLKTDDVVTVEVPLP